MCTVLVSSQPPDHKQAAAEDGQRNYSPPAAHHPSLASTGGCVFADWVKTEPSWLCLCWKLGGYSQSRSQTFALGALHRSNTPFSARRKRSRAAVPLVHWS